MIDTSVVATCKPFVARYRRTRAKKLVAATDPGTSVQIEKSDLIKAGTPIRRRIARRTY